jgi:hypothetical protein
LAEDEDFEKTITLSSVSDEGVVCPFTEGRWKKAGDALVLFILIGMPILHILAFLLL